MQTDSEGGFEFWRFPANGHTWRVERFRVHNTAEVSLLSRDAAGVSTWAPRCTVADTEGGRAATFRTRGSVTADELLEVLMLFMPWIHPEGRPHMIAEAEVRK